MADMFRIGAEYPPPSHMARLNRYKENKKLFLGEAYDVFKRYNGALSTYDQNLVYVSANLAGIIVKKSADFLFGETPTYSAGKEDSSPEQEAIERFVSDNHLTIKNYQSAMGNAYRGDSFYKVRWAQKYDGALPPTIDPFKVIIENQNALYVFPETSVNNATEIGVYHIAYPVEVPNTKGMEWLLIVETHSPGFIEERQFKMNPVNYTTYGNPTSWKIYAEIVEAQNVIETGVPLPLVVHVPNYQADDCWEGIDDLTEHKAILDEINNRLTRIADILDKHSDPAMVVPAGTLEEDAEGNAQYLVGRDKIFEMNDKNEVEPKYITWDGMLLAAFQELDLLMKTLFMTAELPEIALGTGDAGTSGASGISIKFRLNSLLAKINRKRQFYDKGLKEVLTIAQLLETTRPNSTAGYELFNPIIHFKDGLPTDDAETANIMAIRTGGKATLSQKTALMRADDMTEEQAEKELERMSEESKKAAEAQQMIAGSNVPPGAVQEPAPGNTKAAEDKKAKDLTNK